MCLTSTSKNLAPRSEPLHVEEFTAAIGDATCTQGTQVGNSRHLSGNGIVEKYRKRCHCAYGVLTDLGLLQFRDGQTQEVCSICSETSEEDQG